MRRNDLSGPWELRGSGDLRDVQAMCSRLWSPGSRFHPGQLAWNWYSEAAHADGPAPGEAIALWRSAGAVVGFGWAESPDWLELQIDPEHPDVAAEVLDWFEEWSDAPEQSVHTMEGDVCGEALRHAGFVPQPDEWYFRHHLLDLADLTHLIGPASLPTDGCLLRHVEPGEAEARSACHRAAWSDFGPSGVSAQAYERLMAAWPYRHDLDWVAIDAEGNMVASALVWLDEALGVGLVEPVGCVPEHRGRGLAGAVTRAALGRLRDLGAHTAVVTAREDDAPAGPGHLYRSLGFRPGARTVTWTRSLD